MSDYDSDILVWSESQAALRRRLAAGEHINDLIDWENVADEVESVGREQLHTVESLLFQTLIQILKAQGWPDSVDVRNWLADARGFAAQARRRYVPSMRQRIDVAALYDDALKALPDEMDGHGPNPLPTACGLTLDELLNGRQ